MFVDLLVTWCSCRYGLHLQSGVKDGHGKRWAEGRVQHHTRVHANVPFLRC